MIETSARLLRLLSLLQTPRDWSGPQLAERLGVSTRTIRNDVDRLRELGYPVHATPGAAGGYRLGAGARMPPLLLDDEEAVAVAMTLRTAAAASSIAGIEETALRTLAKLEQVLPSRLRHRVGALTAATQPLIWGDGGPTVDPETLAVIAGAVRGGERLRFAYRSHDGTETRRHAEPNRLVPAGRRWYLVGWDVERGDWRTYRVDRIGEPRATGARFAPRDLPAGDAAAFVERALSQGQTGQVATVLLKAPYAEAERLVPSSLGTVEPVDDATSRLRTSADWLQWVAMRIALLGVEFEVESPPELGDALLEIAARVTRGAGARRDGAPRPTGAPR